MITSVDVQTTLIAWMKSQAGITSTIPQGANEIREKQWHGTGFAYPNIRVRISNVVDLSISDCALAKADVSIEVNSNSPSSLEAETIAGLLLRQMSNRHFIYAGMQFVSIRRTGQKQVVYLEDEGIWRSEFLLQAVVA